MLILLSKIFLVTIKVLSYLVSLVIIFFSLIRIPEKNAGLASIANKISFLGSPSSVQRSTDIVGIIGILLYFVIILLLNKIITFD